MMRILLASSSAIGLLAASPAAADTRRAERMLDGPPALFIDPGPPWAPVTANVALRVVSYREMLQICPRVAGRDPFACTLFGTVIIWPDPTERMAPQWVYLVALIHELRHVNVGDFDGSGR